MNPISETYNCDCLQYMRTLPDKCFDLVIADPPYRSTDENAPQKEMREHGGLSNFGDKPTSEILNEIKRISKEQIIFGANNFNLPFKGFVAWDKMVRGSDRYSQVEIASLSTGLATVSTLCQISCYDNDKTHPTQKPVALYGWLIDKYLAKIGGAIYSTHSSVAGAVGLQPTKRVLTSTAARLMRLTTKRNKSGFRASA